jgi:transcription initiation factor IIE alpha subunit
MYNGKMYQKWVNARKERAKEEIENLIKNFNVKDADDELYDFETFIATNSTVKEARKVEKAKVKKAGKVGRPKAKDTLPDRILTFLGEVKKPVTSEEMGQATGSKASSVRTTLLSLRTLGLVKIVDYIKNHAGNHTLLYQLTESSFPELKIYTKEDGYNTINAFLKNNADKYGAIIRAKEVLKKAIRESSTESVLFYSSKGICDGYKVSAMEELMSPKKSKKVGTKEVPTKKVSNKILYKEYTDKIISTFKEDLNKSWTKEDMMTYLGISEASIRRHFDSLTDKKVLKVVGWDQDKSYNRTLPKYQLTSSPLPKIRVYKSESTNTYSTLYGYYNKKLRGKRVVSSKDLYEKMKDAETVLISSSNGYYTGYAVSDLSKAVKEIQGVTSPIRKRKATVKSVPTEMDIETAAVLSKVAQAEYQGNVSNPLPKKKSIFNRFASLFKRAEKVNP